MSLLDMIEFVGDYWMTLSWFMNTVKPNIINELRGGTLYGGSREEFEKLHRALDCMDLKASKATVGRILGMGDRDSPSFQITGDDNKSRFASELFDLNSRIDDELKDMVFLGLMSWRLCRHSLIGQSKNLM
jgi:hypothetical protein